MSKIKVPGGAFYAGEGLEVDSITRTVSAGGGGGVQSDWNQNDETASDYIKNRPGGYISKTLQKTTTKTKTFTLVSDGRYSTNTTTDFSSPFDVFYSPNYSYDVIFNGVRYTDVPIGKRNYDRYLGDYNLIDYPFCIDYEKSAGGGMYEYTCFSNVGGDVEITVKTYFISLVQIPKELVESPSNMIVDATSNIIWTNNPYLVYMASSNEGMSLQNIDSLQSKGITLEVKTNSFKLNSNVSDPSIDFFVNDVRKATYGIDHITLLSSTPGSTKRFKITVDDTGTLTATEVS